MNLPYVEDRRLYSLESSPTLPPSIISFMLTTERDILFSIAKYYCRNRGDIIDAGIFMGASTFCFAKGLMENPRYDGNFHIHSYEKAIVGNNMAKSAAIREKIGDAGSDFGEYLRRSLSPFDDVVKLHIGDITTMSYAGNVEILFLDILKTRAIFRHCNMMFIGRLIPGCSLVVQQDYYWNANWYISAYMEMLNKYFVIVNSAETSCVFLNTETIPSTMYETDPLNNLMPAEIIALLERSRNRASTMFQYTMSELCIIDYAIRSKALAFAQAKIEQFEARFGDIVSEWRGQGSKRRAWVAYTGLSRHLGRLRNAADGVNTTGARAEHSRLDGDARGR